MGPLNRVSMKPTRKTCIILGSVATAILLFGGSLYAWQSGEIDAATKRVEEKKKELSDGQQIAKRRARVQTEYDDTVRDLNHLERSVVQGAGYQATLLKQISSLARRTNLTVTELIPSWVPAATPPPVKKQEGDDKASEGEGQKPKAPPPPPYDILHMDMTVKGKFWNVTKFLNSLRQFPKIIAVEKVDLTPAEKSESGTSPVLTAKLVLTGFAFKGESNTLPSLGAEPVGNPLLPGNGSGSRVRAEQASVIENKQPASGAPASSSVPSTSAAPGIPMPRQAPPQ